LTAHALVMLWLTHRLGSLRGRGLGRTALKASFASLIMGGLTCLTAAGLGAHITGGTLLDQAAVVGGAGLVGLLGYGFLIVILRIEEVYTLFAPLRRLARWVSGSPLSSALRPPRGQGG